MSKELKVHSIYNIDSNSKYLNQDSIQIRTEFELKPCNSLNKEILRIDGLNYNHFKLDTS